MHADKGASTAQRYPGGGNMGDAVSLRGNPHIQAQRQRSRCRASGSDPRRLVHGDGTESSLRTGLVAGQPLGVRERSAAGMLKEPVDRIERNTALAHTPQTLLTGHDLPNGLFDRG